MDVIIFILYSILLVYLGLKLGSKPNDEELKQTKAELERLRDIPVLKSSAYIVVDGDDLEEYKNKPVEEIQEELKPHVKFTVDDNPILTYREYTAEIEHIERRD